MNRVSVVRYGLLAGIVAGATVLAVGALVRTFLPVPTLAELTWDFVVGLIPGALFSVTLDALKYAAKPLLLAGLTLLHLLIAGILGTIYALASCLHPSLFGFSRHRPWLVGAGFGLVQVAVVAVGVSVLLPEAGATWAGALVGFVAFGVLQAELLARFDPAGPAIDRPSAIDLVRRDLLVKGTVGLLVLSVGGVVARSLLSAGQKGGSAVRRAVAALSSYITPNDKFYVVSKNLADPVVNGETWRLEIKGLVSNPLRLTLDELKSLPSVTQTVSLECISNEVGGDLMSNAVWKGVPLRDLLVQAGIGPDAIDVAFYAADEYGDSIQVAKAMDPSTILAYEMNGEPLPTFHGFPVRLLIPGIYGMKNVKWLTGIEPMARDLKGFWQWQGWSDTAVVKTTSRVDVPGFKDVVSGKVTIGGVAFSGDRGISRVEVSLDGGESWQEAHLEKTDSQYTWVIWLLDWQFIVEGSQTITVRAVDGRGDLQLAEEEPPFPDGASGYHQITVTISP